MLYLCGSPRFKHYLRGVWIQEFLAIRLGILGEILISKTKNRTSCSKSGSIKKNEEFKDSMIHVVHIPLCLIGLKL